MSDTILIVDDESTVRQTVREWLAQANLDCEILAAADAESALKLANDHFIDLAILDWNLGSGDDGLQLLQDLSAFHPDIVAIMITGFANMATPLDAMRMGVRDYLDKNHDFSRESLTNSVRKQLDQIRPAKRVRQLHQTLVSFRGAVEQVVPLVQSAATLSEPVPLPDAIRSLVRFLMQVTHAKDGLLLVRHYDAERQPSEICKVYDAEGKALDVESTPFARSIAGSAASLGQPSVMNDLHAVPAGSVELQIFEKAHRNLLAVPMNIATGTQVVIELFDKETGFTADDQHVARSAANLGIELMRQALGQRQTHQLLFDAVAAALKASEQMAASLHGSKNAEKPPELVLQQLRAGLKSTSEDAAVAEASLRLAEAIRVLASKHGQPALEHCLALVERVQELLDQTTGAV
ncbi:MAG TPA: response regulator [Gemmataceae bacterium]|nr:response regulator [Gemmataceae bacterium]